MLHHGLMMIHRRLLLLHCGLTYRQALPAGLPLVSRPLVARPMMTRPLVAVERPVPASGPVPS